MGETAATLTCRFLLYCSLCSKSHSLMSVCMSGLGSGMEQTSLSTLAWSMTLYFSENLISSPSSPSSSSSSSSPAPQPEDLAAFSMTKRLRSMLCSLSSLGLSASAAPRSRNHQLLEDCR